MVTDADVLEAIITGMPADLKAKKAQLAQAQKMVHTAFTELFALGTKYADVKAEIDGYTGTAPFVLLSKDLMGRFMVNYAALRDVADAVHIEMDAHPEF